METTTKPAHKKHKIILVRKGAPDKAHFVQIPAGTGRLEGNRPFLFEGVRVSASIPGRDAVLVLPVSAHSRFATIEALKPVEGQRCAPLLKIKAMPFAGGAAAARVPPGWLRWGASFVWRRTVDGAGEYVPDAAEMEWMVHPIALVDACRTIEVPQGGALFAARRPFSGSVGSAPPCAAVPCADYTHQWYVLDVGALCRAAADGGLAATLAKRVRITTAFPDTIICAKNN